MTLDFISKFKERLEDLNRNLADLNFEACLNISTDFIRSSEFVIYPEGIFIGEFFESVFSNLNSINENFKTEKDEVEPIKNEIDKLARFIKESIPTKDTNVKAELFDMMVKVRYLVTEFQIKNFREGKRKKREIRERFGISESL